MAGHFGSDLLARTIHEVEIGPGIGPFGTDYTDQWHDVAMSRPESAVISPPSPVLLDVRTWLRPSVQREASVPTV